MGKLKKWEEIEEGFHFTPEEDAEMELEMELIKATIEARKKAKMTQRELSEKSDVK